ncbi:hypothetical protein FJZ31_01460 [Candidatus Poribacteria bacterium]|nr:hypothetical protein [Candidatus Poribacteria bacterium]
MFKFISFILVIGCMIVFGSGNLLAAEANDAEMHYFRGIEYYIHKQYYDATLEFGKAIRLKPNYADAESAFKLAYAKLKGDDSQVNIVSPGYGCLGAYQWCIFGFAIWFFGRLESGALDNIPEEAEEIIFIGGPILGAVIGGYLGLKADKAWKKGCLIGGAVIATSVALYMYYRIGEALGGIMQ